MSKSLTKPESPEPMASGATDPEALRNLWDQMKHRIMAIYHIPPESIIFKLRYTDHKPFRGHLVFKADPNAGKPGTFGISSGSSSIYIHILHICI